MSYHKFVTTCWVCDGSGKGFIAVVDGVPQDTTLKCVTCKGTGKEEYGSFEVFEVPQPGTPPGEEATWNEGMREPGWYWWACFPGCTPEGDPEGPFATEQEAINAAQED